MIFVRQARSQAACAKTGVAPAANAASATIPSSPFTEAPSLRRGVRLEPNDVARLARELIVDSDIDEAVRALANVANTVFADQQRLAIRHDVPVDREAHELPVVGRHAADEDVALPVRELVARVQHEARDADRRHEERLRLLHSFLVAGRVDLGAERVVRAVTDDGPAVVLALLDDVELVAALRTVLALPERVGGPVEVEALRIAMAVTPDLGQRAGAADERVVLRDAAVVVQANDLALTAAQVLRRMTCEI